MVGRCQRGPVEITHIAEREKDHARCTTPCFFSIQDACIATSYVKSRGGGERVGAEFYQLPGTDSALGTQGGISKDRYSQPSGTVGSC